MLNSVTKFVVLFDPKNESYIFKANSSQGIHVTRTLNFDAIVFRLQ